MIKQYSPETRPSQANPWLRPASTRIGSLSISITCFDVVYRWDGLGSMPQYSLVRIPDKARDKDIKGRSHGILSPMSHHIQLMGTENVPETWAFSNYRTRVITREDIVIKDFPLGENSWHAHVLITTATELLAYACRLLSWLVLLDPVFLRTYM